MSGRDAAVCEVLVMHLARTFVCCRRPQKHLTAAAAEADGADADAIARHCATSLMGQLDDCDCHSKDAVHLPLYCSIF